MLAIVVLRPFLAIFTRHSWSGQENLDQGGQGIVVASNHLSWFDPLVVSQYLYLNGRPPRFLAKESLFRIPLVGRVIRGAGQIPVYRESREAVASVRAAVAAAGRGECVVVYPEGTITRDPRLWPMAGRTGVARIALVSGAPVVPLAHWGAQQIMWPYRKQFRLLPVKRMQVRAGRPVDLDDLRDRPMDAETLRIATGRIVAAITALLEEIRGESAPPVRLDRAALRRQQGDTAP
ncbi:MAG: 1-acyl-sn-glycerol-3-phosphate acyltransferase [Actinomycetota bacterium]|nr:MAG: 1-acyl-sn-glycerol-3-phosphate acyltransferase [Actinomycetota bacterium]